MSFSPSRAELNPQERVRRCNRRERKHSLVGYRFRPMPGSTRADSRAPAPPLPLRASGLRSPTASRPDGSALRRSGRCGSWSRQTARQQVLLCTKKQRRAVAGSGEWDSPEPAWCAPRVAPRRLARFVLRLRLLGPPPPSELPRLRPQKMRARPGAMPSTGNRAPSLESLIRVMLRRQEPPALMLLKGNNSLGTKRQVLTFQSTHAMRGLS